jgi:hypothetical protein
MGEINIKYNWYVRIVIIILTLYMVFITLMCLKHKKKSEQEITLTTKTHVITEMDGDREINWYSEDTVTKKK